MLDLVQTVLAQPAHPAPHRGGAELVGRGALQRERADLLVHDHHLVKADPAAVAHSAAAHATGGFVGLDRELGGEAMVAQHLGGNQRALLAVGAQRAG